MSEQSILNLIKKHKRFLVSMHVNPDADAIASALALALYLKQRGRQVTVVNEDPIPKRLQFLPKTSLIKKYKKGMKVNYDVAIVADSGDYPRIGKVDKLIDPKKPLINIDHHVSNTRFGKVNLVKDKASSTAEVLYGLLKKGRLKLTRDVALLLYVGIMTDTGSFRYESTTKTTHLIVSELLKFNIPITDLYRRLYENIPQSDFKKFSSVMDKVEYYNKNKVACLVLRKQIASKFTKDFDLRDKVFSFLRCVQGIEVFVIVTEETAKRTRLNFRSQKKFDVARLAAQFGGGGHKRASGATVDAHHTKVKSRVLAAIKKGL